MSDKLHDYLEKINLRIGSSYQELDQILKKLNRVKNVNKRDEIINGVEFSLNDVKISMLSLDQIISENIKTFRELTQKNELTDIKEFIIFAEHNRKLKAIQDIADKRRIEYVTKPEEDYIYFRGEKQYVDINLFENKFDVAPNEADFEFYKCFQLAGKNVIFKNDNMTKLLLYKANGDLDFKGELQSIDDENNLAQELDRSFSKKYNIYMKSLQFFLRGITEDILSSREDDPSGEGTIGFLESIFIKGFDYDGQHYTIPSSFRHFIQLKIEMKLELIHDKISGKEIKAPVFNGIKVFPYDKKLMPTLEFDNFLDYFSKYFHKLTKHCLINNQEWKTFSNFQSDAALCYYPIPTDWENAKMPPAWNKFFSGKASERLLHRVYFYVGACLDSKNVAQQTLIISDDGGTGKGEFIRLLKEILPKGMMTGLSNSALINDHFAVTALGLYKSHILVNSEYDGKNFNSNLMKQISGGDTITAEIKNGADLTWNTSGTKIILTSNRICYLTEHAIRRRVIPVSFISNFNPIEGMDEKFRNELLEQGHEFIKYCWKIYQRSPFRRRDGGYIVLNPTQEVEFLKKKKLDSDDYQLSLLKAFSRDVEISRKFYSGDYDENGSNDDFQEMYDTLFELDDKSFMFRAELIEKLSEYFKDYTKFPASLQPYLKIWAEKFNYSSYSSTLMSNSKELMRFYKFLEAKGHVTKQKGPKKYRGFMNLKMKDINTIIKEANESEETNKNGLIIENAVDEYTPTMSADEDPLAEFEELQEI